MNPTLGQLLAAYQSAKATAISRLTELQRSSGEDCALATLHVVSPTKRLHLRAARNAVEKCYYNRANFDQSTAAWNALRDLSDAHSAYYSAHQAAIRNENDERKQ